MADDYDKKIHQLESEIAEIKAKKEKDQHERGVLEGAYEQLKHSLHSENVTLDSFVRFAYRDVKRVVARIEKERAKEEQIAANNPDAKPAPTRKKATKPGRKPKAKVKAKAKKPIKIPAGRYTNIPPNLEEVIEVNHKGPRPKLVRAHAEEIGEERFFAECRVQE